MNVLSTFPYTVNSAHYSKFKVPGFPRHRHPSECSVTMHFKNLNYYCQQQQYHLTDAWSTRITSALSWCLVSLRDLNVRRYVLYADYEIFARFDDLI